MAIVPESAAPGPSILLSVREHPPQTSVLTLNAESGLVIAIGVVLWVFTKFAVKLLVPTDCTTTYSFTAPVSTLSTIPGTIPDAAA